MSTAGAPTPVTPASRLPGDDEMYRALVDRDPAYEGVFHACVKTTGIFCRPTCTARKPKRGNVEFVATADDAIRAGYRACRVCRPLEPDPHRPAWVGDLMDRVERGAGGRLTDEDLASAGIDPTRARRYFKRHFGVTFQVYQRAWRLGEAMKRIGRGDPIAKAAHASGYESESGFREAYGRLFGCPPGATRDAACLRATWLRTPLGPMIAIASAGGLSLLEFVDRRALGRQIRRLRAHFDQVAVPGTQVVVPGRSEHLERAADELGAYFAGARRDFTVTLDRPGTPFQRLVWDRLRDIPYGETASYARIAAAVGMPGGSRAVGRANGDNPLAVIVPCHRVVRSDGALGGYGGGLWRKRHLLDHERCHASRAEV